MSHPNYKCHLFVCTNTKEKGQSCGPKESAAIRLELKKTIEEKYSDKKDLFRINASGCLGLCEKGVAAVCYPSGEWKTGITKESLPELVSWVSNQIEK